MLRLLRDTWTTEEWNAPTDCDRWTVKDIVAHLIGWAECFASFKEFRHQFAASISRRKELGNPVNAQNEQQVEDRRHLSPERDDRAVRKLDGSFLGLRMKVGKVAALHAVLRPLDHQVLQPRLHRSRHLHARHLHAPRRHQPGHRATDRSSNSRMPISYRMSSGIGLAGTTSTRRSIWGRSGPSSRGRRAGRRSQERDLSSRG